VAGRAWKNEQRHRNGDEVSTAEAPQLQERSLHLSLLIKRRRRWSDLNSENESGLDPVFAVLFLSFFLGRLGGLAPDWVHTNRGF
jgi:hypothetical protein